jgi:hypothetical protein
MGPCYTCNNTVAFGGIKDHGFRFCSKACHAQKAGFIQSLAAVPAELVESEALRIRNGLCAKCGRTGHVEFHSSMFVWSAILITRTSERTFIGCTTCARKTQALASAGTLLLGWWGIPFGLVFTPVAVLANAYQMVRSGPRARPSAKLSAYARERLAFAQQRSPSAIGAAPAFARVEPRF